MALGSATTGIGRIPPVAFPETGRSAIPPVEVGSPTGFDLEAGGRERQLTGISNASTPEWLNGSQRDFVGPAIQIDERAK